MSTTTTIQSEERVANSKATLKELRENDRIPAVVYGYKTETTSISINERDLINALREVGRNGVVQLVVDDKKLNVVLNDYQTDVLVGNITHADFLVVDMTEELEVSVTVQLIGEAPGEKEGGTVQQPNWELDILVKPSEIPETFEVDVSKLEIGDTLTVEDIREESKFEILNDDEFALVTISAPRTEEELEALDEGTEVADVEPEVIGEDEE